MSLNFEPEFPDNACDDVHDDLQFAAEIGQMLLQRTMEQTKAIEALEDERNELSLSRKELRQRVKQLDSEKLQLTEKLLASETQLGAVKLKLDDLLLANRDWISLQAESRKLAYEKADLETECSQLQAVLARQRTEINLWREKFQLCKRRRQELKMQLVDRDALQHQRQQQALKPILQRLTELEQENMRLQTEQADVRTLQRQVAVLRSNVEQFDSGRSEDLALLEIARNRVVSMHDAIQSGTVDTVVDTPVHLKSLSLLDEIEDAVKQVQTSERPVCERSEDAMEEFFTMTAFSVAINNGFDLSMPSSQLLYAKASSLNIPFYQWNSWLQRELLSFVANSSSSSPSLEEHIKATC